MWNNKATVVDVQWPAFPQTLKMSPSKALLQGLLSHDLKDTESTESLTGGCMAAA